MAPFGQGVATPMDQDKTKTRLLYPRSRSRQDWFKKFKKSCQES